MYRTSRGSERSIWGCNFAFVTIWLLHASSVFKVYTLTTPNSKSILDLKLRSWELSYFGIGDFHGSLTSVFIYLRFGRYLGIFYFYSSSLFFFVVYTGVDMLAWLMRKTERVAYVFVRWSIPFAFSLLNFALCDVNREMVK